MGKNLHWLLLTTVFVLSITMAGVGTASPELPVIRVEPGSNTAEVGETFDVSITVTGITENASLYGWECRITFNPGVINAVNATEGPFLKDSGYNTTWLPIKIKNEIGTITIGAMLTYPFPLNGAVGSGTLVTVAFKAVGQGATGLEFKDKEKDTELWTVIYPSQLYLQDTLQIEHTAEGGSFSNAGPPIPLHLIAGVVVVVAVCTVAVFYFRRKRASTGT